MACQMDHYSFDKPSVFSYSGVGPNPFGIIVISSIGQVVNYFFDKHNCVL